MIIKNNEITKEQLEKAKELLIIIDMINGFVKTGKLAFPSILEIVPRQQELLEEYVKQESAVLIFVVDEHSIKSPEFKTYGEHAIKGSGEELVIDELKDWQDKAITIKKNNTNFMFAKETIPLLEKLINLKFIKIMGCLSDVCIKNGAIGIKCYFDEANRDVEVGVFEDAIDTFDSVNHQRGVINKNSLEEMKANGVKLYPKKVLTKKKGY